MYAPSGVGCSVGVALRWSGVTTVRDARKEIAISMPCVSAWRRYPWVVVGSCADMEGMGRGVGDCTRMAERHHGAQCVSPLRSERRRGGADEIPGWCGRALRVGEEYDRGHRLQAERVVVHLHRRDGCRVILAVLLPCSSRLYCVNGLEEGLERGGEF